MRTAQGPMCGRTGEGRAPRPEPRARSSSSNSGTATRRAHDLALVTHRLCLEGGDGIGDRVMRFDDVSETQEVEHVTHVRTHAGDLQTALILADVLDLADEHTPSSGADVTDFGEIHDDVESLLL